MTSENRKNNEEIMMVIEPNIQDLTIFQTRVNVCFDNLFSKAKQADEFAYVFSLLDKSSGSEAAGWQPIQETLYLFHDLRSLIDGSESYTRIRLCLMLYCHIIEANFIYHVLYNMLLSAENEGHPRVFNFLDKYRNGNPPSAKSKVQEIRKKSKLLKIDELDKILDEVFNDDIRNAFAHSDYILWQDEFRSKHKGYKSIKMNEVLFLVNKAIIFFEAFFEVLMSHKKSYNKGHVIKNRKSKDGKSLADIMLEIDENDNELVGFTAKAPSPIW